MEPEYRALAYLVRQINDLLQQIPAADYSQKLELYGGSSIGMHCRHIQDFFYTLSAGVETGYLDYGLRNREPALENDPEQLAKTLKDRMSALKDYPLSQPLIVLSDLGPEKKKYASTYGRELQFVFHHTVHHMAMIKMGLKYLDSPIRLSSEFGLAPSTIAFQASSQKHE